MIKKVKEVLNNSIFFIPNYQRDYAWEEKNLDDLWEDLLGYIIPYLIDKSKNEIVILGIYKSNLWD